nr:unnamed protein product [Callosobruchus analis]
MMASPVPMNETNHVIYNRTERYCYISYADGVLL